MKTLTLTRMERTDFATYGQLADEEERALAVTLERPWVENARDESCVPTGTYVTRRYRSPKRGYDVFMLEAVPGREAVELHIGNLPHDTEGCILLGTAFGVVNGQPGITGSSSAFKRFMERMTAVNAFTLVIGDAP